MTGSEIAASPWEIEGQRLSPLMEGVFAVVIAATDPAIAVQVAIGVARAQATQNAQRRVAIADLVGEAPALEALLTGDDPHGISDSFLYGVSLNKIARPMAGTRNVFVMPSGTEAVAHESVYANDRWRRLTAGFHQVGALLIAVAVPGTAGFAELCEYIGALMPVGDTTFPIPAGVRLIAPPPPPQPEPPPPPPPESAARARAAAAENDSSRRRRLLAMFVALAAVAVALGAMWPQIVSYLPASVSERLGGRASDGAQLVVPQTPMDSVASDTPVGNGADDSTIAGDSAGVTADSAGASRDALTVANPGDSSIASRYAIYFRSANTREAAMPEPKVAALNAVALSPVKEENNEQWFRVTVGAAVTRAEAQALLTRLQAERVVGAGSIVAVPYAFVLESGVAVERVRARLIDFTTLGISAYALQQVDGSATLYTGAFESPQQALILADALRTLRVAPVLVYRTGRAI